MSAIGEASATTLSAATFPRPKVPTHPVLSFRALFGSAAPSDVSPVSDVGANVRLTSGRVALATALFRLKSSVGNDRVLLPAYNCRSMVDAVSWVGAEPVLYRSQPDLTVDFDDVVAKLDGGARALVVVHYFGFPQKEIVRIRALCDERGVALIEDCAHCFFGSFEGKPLGSFGDYAIASPTKFFPVYDGGLLVSARHSLADVELRNGHFAFELKALLNNVEKSFSYSRLKPLNWLLALPLYVKDRLWSLAKTMQPPLPTEGLGPEASGDAYAFDPGWVDVRMSTVSAVVCRRTPLKRLVDLRRRHYETLARAFEAVPGCRPLYRELPAGVVPYVFPLLVDDAQRVFQRVKSRGVPLFRWEDVRHGICATSTLYSEHLFQLPCHQELSPKELDWLITEVKNALEA